MTTHEHPDLPKAQLGRRTLGRHEVHGKDGVFIVTEPGGPVVATFYALDESPGWWRGHCHGRVRRMYAPDAGPLTVAERLLYR